MKANTETQAGATVQRAYTPFFGRRGRSWASQAQPQPFFKPAPIQRMEDEATPEHAQPGVFQAKLNIGRSDDAFEREADHVADQVVGMPASQVQRQEDEEEAQRQPEQEEQEAPVQAKPLADRVTPYAPPGVQRRCPACEAEHDRALMSEEEASREVEEDAEAPVQTKSLADRVTPYAPPGVQRRCPACEAEHDRALMSEEEASREVEEDAEGEEEPVQAQSTGDQPRAGAGVEAHLARSKGGGNALSDGVRSFMEPRFGYGFDDVRVHNDTAAANSARSIGAAAYTSGKDIYFGAGRYQPDTVQGKQLLAHELTHVVQQAKGAQRVRRKPVNSVRKIASSISAYKRPSVQLAPNVTAVALNRTEIAAGSGRTARATATVGGGITVAWSIQGAARGATIAGSGRRATITAPAGSTGGVITIRAADAANAADFTDVNLTLVQVQFQAPAFTFAPAMPGFAPANTMDASVCNNTATGQATVTPAPRPVLWSIRGNRRGATIGLGTGVINPSATLSGNITVRVRDAAVRRAFADQVLTIRAHPTGITRTTRAGNLNYGATYTHTFRGSGGSLNGVFVTERVDCGNDPFNFCPGFLPIANGTINAPLNAAARLNDFIGTPSGTPGIDVNRFLPSPPNPGLPQVLDTPQILSWRSDQCSPAGVSAAVATAADHWVPFRNVAITVTLQGRRRFRVVTRDNGVRRNEPYSGPALIRVSRVRFNPPTLAADGNAATTTNATARVVPPATALRWSFQGQNLGAALVNATPGAGNPAVITTGNIAGRVTVRAASVAHPLRFAEGRLRLRQVVIGRIRFRPASVPAGAGSTTRATVRTSPGVRNVNWTIQGPALGAAIARNADNSATITRGAGRGRVTVRATDQNDATKFNDASLVLR